MRQNIGRRTGERQELAHAQTYSEGNYSLESDSAHAHRTCAVGRYRAALRKFERGPRAQCRAVVGEIKRELKTEGIWTANGVIIESEWAGHIVQCASDTVDRY